MKMGCSFCRLRFLGKVLKVDRASKLGQDNNKLQHGHREAPFGKDSLLPTSTSSLVNNATVSKDTTVQVSKSGSLPAPEPIAPKLGVDYPFPPHLEYVILFTSFEFLNSL